MGKSALQFRFILSPDYRIEFSVVPANLIFKLKGRVLRNLATFGLILGHMGVINSGVYLTTLCYFHSTSQGKIGYSWANNCGF